MSTPSWAGFLAPVYSWHFLPAFSPVKWGGSFLLPSIKKKNQHLLSFYINSLQIIPVLPHLKILHNFRHTWHDVHVFAWLRVRVVIAAEKLHFKSGWSQNTVPDVVLWITGPFDYTGNMLVTARFRYISPWFLFPFFWNLVLISDFVFEMFFLWGWKHQNGAVQQPPP